VCASCARRCASWLPRKALQFGLVVCQRPSTSVGTIARATPSHWQVRRLYGARPPRSRRKMLFAAARSAAPAGRCEGGPRGPRPRPSPGGAARLSARSARVAARGGCAGGAAVGGRGALAGGLACSVRGVARLGGGVDARRAAAATRALGSGDARDGSSYDDKIAAASLLAQ